MAAEVKYRLVMTFICGDAADRDAITNYFRQVYIDRRDGVGLPASLERVDVSNDEYMRLEPRISEDITNAS